MVLVPAEVTEFVQRFRGDDATMNHTVPWAPQRWLGYSGLAAHRDRVEAIHDAASGGETSPFAGISRSMVAGFAGDPVTLFLAAMIWGHGTNGYGPYRVSRIIAAAGDELVPRLQAMITTAQTGPAEAWDAMAETAKLRWLGPSFGTKVLYFAAVASPPAAELPLIADINTSWGIWDLTKSTGDPIARSFESRDGYLRYVDRAHQWAAELGAGFQADDVERALFEHGKGVTRW